MIRPVRTERAIAPPDVPAINPVVEAIYRTGKVEDAEGIGRDCFPASIPPESGFALYEFVRTRGADRTLEVGMAYGLSTLHLCQAPPRQGPRHSHRDRPIAIPEVAVDWAAELAPRRPRRPAHLPRGPLTTRRCPGCWPPASGSTWRSLTDRTCSTTP